MFQGVLCLRQGWQHPRVRAAGEERKSKALRFCKSLLATTFYWTLSGMQSGKAWIWVDLNVKIQGKK